MISPLLLTVSFAGAFVAIIVYALLLGHTEYHQKGFIVTFANIMLIICIGKIHYFFLGYLVLKLTPSSATRNGALGKIPFLWLFYCVLIFGPYLIMVVYGLPFIAEEDMPKLYLVSAWLTWVFLWFCHVSWSDPGVITKENVNSHSSKYDFDLVYFGPKECETCHFVKPARSKHCASCGRCVARFDHHCSWINNDVGALNLWKFCLYLSNTAVYSSYMAYIFIRILMHRLTFFKQEWRRFVRKDEDPSIADITSVFINYHPALVFITVFAIVISFVLWFFFFHKVGEVIENHTTNERMKRIQAKHYYEFKAKNGTLTEREKSVDLSRNFYKRDVWTNIMEVLFYASSRKQKTL